MRGAASCDVRAPCAGPATLARPSSKTRVEVEIRESSDAISLPWPARCIHHIRLRKYAIRAACTRAHLRINHTRTPSSRVSGRESRARAYYHLCSMQRRHVVPNERPKESLTRSILCAHLCGRLTPHDPTLHVTPPPPPPPPVHSPCPLSCASLYSPFCTFFLRSSIRLAAVFLAFSVRSYSSSSSIAFSYAPLATLFEVSPTTSRVIAPIGSLRSAR